MRKPITRAEYNKVCQQVKDALRLASNHDPDLVKWLRQIDKTRADHHSWLLDVNSRLAIIERQLERMGAPQYRTIRKGKVA